MKKYSYYLFPKPFVVIGYILIFLSLAEVSRGIISMIGGNHSVYFAAPIALIFISVIVIFFKTKLIIEEGSRLIIKESCLLNMTLSREIIKVPPGCTRLLIREKTKTGTGYYRFILPVSYTFKSFDMFFSSGRGLIRLINTDYNRSVKIAEFLKSNFKLDYSFEKSV